MTVNQQQQNLLEEIKCPILRKRFEEEYAKSNDIASVNFDLDTIIAKANLHLRHSMEFPISLYSLKGVKRADMFRAIFDELDQDFYVSSQTRSRTDNFIDSYDLMLLSVDSCRTQNEDRSFTHTQPILDALRLYRYAVSQPEWLTGGVCVLALEINDTMFGVLQRMIAHNMGYSTWQYIKEDECDCYDLVDKSHKAEYGYNEKIVYRG